MEDSRAKELIESIVKEPQITVTSLDLMSDPEYVIQALTTALSWHDRIKALGAEKDKCWELEKDIHKICAQQLQAKTNEIASLKAELEQAHKDRQNDREAANDVIVGLKDDVERLAAKPKGSAGSEGEE